MSKKQKFYLIHFDTGSHDEFRLFSSRGDAISFINQIMSESGHDWEAETDTSLGRKHICWSRVEFGQWLHLRTVVLDSTQPIVNPFAKSADNNTTL